MNSRFDDLAKGAANGMSRRDILRGAITGGFVAALAVFGMGKASADPECEPLCAAIYPPPRGKETQQAFGQCVSSCQHCLESGGTPCVPGACCNSETEHCENGACVSDCFVCGVNAPVQCGVGGPIGACYGFGTTEGGCDCVEDFFCNGAPACSTSADCPAGSVCTVDTCCGDGVCGPVCGTNETLNANLQSGSGSTASGR